MARNNTLSSKTCQSILVIRNKGYSMREIAKKLKISYNATPFTEQGKLALTRIERGVGNPGAHLSKRTNAL
jgi:transcriptional regulator